MSLADELDETLTRLSEAEAYIEAAIAPQRQALQRIADLKGHIQRALKRGVEPVIHQPFTTASPVCDYRRAHRPGRQSRIESDTELRAFIDARIDRMTFIELEDAIANAFPPTRQVKKSAIHRWWQRSQSVQNS